MKFLAIVTFSCAVLLCTEAEARTRFVRQARPGRPTPATTPLPDGATPAVVDGNGSLLGCNCPAPPQFNPVCGNDGVTYGNQQKLACARTCGRNVRLAYVGSC
ncbi:hypothetical protein L9F63_016776 [Diploptera punctata]|uniref:Kazal-like domain-containing protein n=1 Tax=Diploptera punctata TaxID=6984 RepID=A0AAD8EHT8_DIPPU|nr:hypothetical protein L9F63_016776 [Diploptera punctata]